MARITGQNYRFTMTFVPMTLDKWGQRSRGGVTNRRLTVLLSAWYITASQHGVLVIEGPHHPTISYNIKPLTDVANGCSLREHKQLVQSVKKHFCVAFSVQMGRRKLKTPSFFREKQSRWRSSGELLRERTQTPSAKEHRNTYLCTQTVHIFSPTLL